MPPNNAKIFIRGIHLESGKEIVVDVGHVGFADSI
jgi:hypothetical protein